jgi:hypothetical protein
MSSNPSTDSPAEIGSGQPAEHTTGEEGMGDLTPVTPDTVHAAGKDGLGDPL